MNQTLRTLGSAGHTVLTTRWYWLGLVVLGLFMEGVALYYQYGVGDEPCQICIHTRIWVAAFILLGVLMCVLPRHTPVNLIGHLLAVICMLGLWERCKYLLDVENGKGEGSCEFFLGFPEWFALDVWFPAVFEVRNLCGFTPEMIWGITMAQALIVVSSLLVAMSLVALGLNLVAWRRG